MINKVKVRLLVGLGGCLLFGFVLLIGYSIGSQTVTKHNQSQVQKQAKKLLEKDKQQATASVLSKDQVKAFLTHYYTKEKLGENNQRIKPLMTEAAYSEEITKQEEALQQVYKDYLLHYRFDDAVIYINPDTYEALAEVTYEVTYVSDLSDQQETNTQRETKTVKLVFSKGSDSLLVNQLTIWDGSLEDLATQESVDSDATIPALPSSTTIPESN